ncbi:MAG: Txe/YoeB family addiction module toxin [Selenomonadaceae bacterium]|nr:Txe/YoeB family addiction module toxin [Selenomonadaceae bacterium]
MFKLWNDTSWEEYVEWQNQADKIVERINVLLKDIDRNGAAKGIGKPEKLKHRRGWSRRITSEHRLIYDVFVSNGETILFVLSCKGHYE